MSGGEIQVERWTNLDYLLPMTIQVNIAEAKGKLSSLVQAALDGEDVTLARNGRPAVRLVPVHSMRARQLGTLQAMGWTCDLPLELFAPEPADSNDHDFPSGS